MILQPIGKRNGCIPVLLRMMEHRIQILQIVTITVLGKDVLQTFISYQMTLRDPIH